MLKPPLGRPFANGRPVQADLPGLRRPHAHNTRASVLLPLPLGPTTAVTVPGRNVKLTSCSTGRLAPGGTAVTPSTWINPVGRGCVVPRSSW